MRKSLVVIALMVFSALIVVIVGRERSLTLVFGPIEVKPIDFSSLVLSPKPNQFLVCPVDYCTAIPHMISPVFVGSADELQLRWLAMIEKQPRIEKGKDEGQTLQRNYIQRSAIMRYPDSITVRFIPLDNDRSTIAIYSRSHYGNSDLGVNENRILSWLAAME